MRGQVSALCLAGSFFFFIATVLSDWAYASSYEIQWNNFASWLLVGALVLAGAALAFWLVGLWAPDGRTRMGITGALAIGAGWLIGFFSALMHARDAWASMPGGLVLSLIASLCIAVAVAIEFFATRTGGER
jgi:uncharacterized membrane protein